MNRFIYYPSFSTGVVGTCLKNNTEIFPGITSRFYDESVPKEYYYPFFLVTAGHNYETENYREKLGLGKNVIVMGDSGGYQIASGKLKWKSSLPQIILNWLEENADISMNLDIPTGFGMHERSKFSVFNECLDTSYDNAVYFDKNRKGKTKLLNVLQGNNIEQINIWYNKVKGIKFDGWALGNSGRFDKLMLKLSVMNKNKEFDNNNVRFIHILGISKLFDFLVISKLQNMFDKLYNNRIIFSIDSSSPSIASAFGQLYFGNNFKKGVLTSFNIHNYDADKYDDNALLPCNCFICKNLTFKDIKPFDTKSYLYTSYHNFYNFVNLIDISNRIITNGDDVIEQILGRDIVLLLNSLEKIILAKDSVAEFNRNINIFNRVKNIYELSDNSGISKFLTNEEK